MDTQVVPIGQGGLIPFAFEEVRLKESCWMGGKPYFTRRAIGEFLEYSNKTVDRAVAKIIERNPHIKQFAVLVNLTSTDGKKYDQEVYDPIGLQLIIFESHQPKAKLYKIAVAHLVWAFMNGGIKPSKWSEKGDLVSATKQILSHPPNHKRGRLVADLAEREGLSLQQTYRRIVMATGERLLTHSGRPAKIRSDKGTTRYPEERAKVLAFVSEHPGYLKKEVHKALGLKVSCARMGGWIREAGR